MRMFETILSIGIGCGLLIAAFRVKTFHEPGLGTSRVGRPVPLWFGRLICVIVGAVFLLSAFQGIRHK
jgi:hypothetical protein